MLSCSRGTLRALAFALVAVAVVLIQRPAVAAEKADALAVVANAVAVVEHVRADENFRGSIEPYLARARAVMIVPRFYKGGFILGASYGNAALLVRDDSGQLSPPAFFRLMGGSLGLQIGGQEVGMVFLIMTQNGLDALLKDKFKFGAGAGVSVATFGANVEASTTSAAGADILAFARSKGAFGGGAVEGSVIEARQAWNQAVYGPGASTRAIVFDRRYGMPKNGDALIQALTVNTGAPVRPLDAPPLDAPPGTTQSGNGAAGGGVSGDDGLPPARPNANGGTRNGPLLLGPVESAPLAPAR